MRHLTTHLSVVALCLGASVAQANPLSIAVAASEPCTALPATPNVGISDVIRAQIAINGYDMTVSMEGRLECRGDTDQAPVRAVYLGDLFVDLRQCVAVDADIQIAEFSGADPSDLQRKLTTDIAKAVEASCVRLSTPG